MKKCPNTPQNDSQTIRKPSQNTPKTVQNPEGSSLSSISVRSLHTGDQQGQLAEQKSNPRRAGIEPARGGNRPRDRRVGRPPAQPLG